MPKLSWFSALFAVAGLSGLALAAGLKHKAGSETWTEPAGVPGDRSIDALTAPDYFGVQALKIWDFDRRACRLQIEQGSFNAQGSTVLEAVKICEPKLTQGWKRADIGAGKFVTSVAVCTESRKEDSPLVRGVELRGVALSDAAKTISAKKPVRIEFAGCAKWSKPTACPPGSVATGIRAHVSGDQGVVGFSLRCHRVEAVP
ncbi:MAG TPA: hypothetical protein VIM73_15945 [Polyangiaceae bacterium]